MEAQESGCILSKKRKNEEPENAINVKRPKTSSQPSGDITPISLFSDLPGDITTHILKHMDDGTLARFSITAKSLALISLIDLVSLTDKEFKERSPLKTPLALSFVNGQPFKHSYFLREGFRNFLESISASGSMNSLERRFDLFKFSQYCDLHQFVISKFIKSIVYTGMYEDAATEYAKTFSFELAKSFFSKNPIALEVELAFKCKKIDYGFKYIDEDYNKILFDISNYLIYKGFDEVAYYYAKDLDPSIHLLFSKNFYEKGNMIDTKKYLKLAADQGQVQAQYNLGCIYDQESNLDEAKRYLKLAADQGQVQAQYNLGCIYDQESNLDEAKRYWTLAANQGQVQAQYNLGVMYNQEGNHDEAKKYWALAANQGDFKAQGALFGRV
jgi:tetratricopeptide (TPR) repeat protein